MEKREIAKFLSGFFTAGVLINLSVILLTVYTPYKLLGGFFDFRAWTITLIGFFVLSIIAAFLGWGVRSGRKYITLLMLMTVVFSFYVGFDVLKLKNINLFQGNVASSLAQNSSLPQMQNADSSQTEGVKDFSFSLGGDKYDGGKQIATDKDGNLYVAGFFQGTVNLDVSGGLYNITSLGNSLISSATDIYLAKYSSQRKLLWGISIGSSGKDMPFDLKLDSNENIYLAGYFGGLADFDPSANAEYNLDAGTGRDAFIAKYDNSGQFKWAKKIGNPEKIPFDDDDRRFEEARSIAIDSNNNVYVSGVFDGTINLDEPNEMKPDNTFSAVQNARNIFIAKYSADGNYLNGIVTAGTTDDEAAGITADSSGVYMSGYFFGKSNFDFKNKNNKVSLISSGSDSDIFLAKYDSDLNFVWVKKWGSDGNDTTLPGNLVMDKDSNVYLAGNFTGIINIGKNLVSRGEYDILFTKIDKDGKVIFSKSFGGSRSEQARSISLDADNNLYLTGKFKIVCDFGTTKTSQTLTSNSGGLASDGFVAKYSSVGDYVWAQNIGGEVTAETEEQSIEDVAFDQNNNPIITGYFYENLDFNSTESLNLTSKGESDAVIVEYNSNGEIE
jgi:hypothetical protein